MVPRCALRIPSIARWKSEGHWESRFPSFLFSLIIPSTIFFSIYQFSWGRSSNWEKLGARRSIKSAAKLLDKSREKERDPPLISFKKDEESEAADLVCLSPSVPVNRICRGNAGLLRRDPCHWWLMGGERATRMSTLTKTASPYTMSTRP